MRSFWHLLLVPHVVVLHPFLVPHFAVIAPSFVPTKQKRTFCSGAIFGAMFLCHFRCRFFARARRNEVVGADHLILLGAGPPAHQAWSSKICAWVLELKLTVPSRHGPTLDPRRSVPGRLFPRVILDATELGSLTRSEQCACVQD